MKRFILIIAGLAAVAIAALTYIALSTYDTLVSERNARQTAPARAAKLAKLREARVEDEPVYEPTTTTTTNEKEQVG